MILVKVLDDKSRRQSIAFSMVFVVLIIFVRKCQFGFNHVAQQLENVECSIGRSLNLFKSQLDDPSTQEMRLALEGWTSTQLTENCVSYYKDYYDRLRILIVFADLFTYVSGTASIVLATNAFTDWFPMAVH